MTVNEAMVDEASPAIDPYVAHIEALKTELSDVREALRNVSTDRAQMRNRWEEFSRDFCHNVREASDAESISICEAGLSRFCTRIGVDYIPKTVRVRVTITIEAEVPADEEDSLTNDIHRYLDNFEPGDGSIEDIESGYITLDEY